MKRIETIKLGQCLLINLKDLFYIPWMKRIETLCNFCSAIDGSCLNGLDIYSIYLEWKGLRPLLSPSLLSLLSLLSILYTLNEKDWDVVITKTLGIGLATKLSILYTLNEKDWDTTYHCTVHCPSSIYSIYLEWKGLRQYYFYTGNESCMNDRSILYTLNEKDWDNLIL